MAAALTTTDRVSVRENMSRAPFFGALDPGVGPGVRDGEVGSAEGARRGRLGDGHVGPHPVQRMQHGALGGLRRRSSRSKYVTNIKIPFFYAQSAAGSGTGPGEAGCLAVCSQGDRPC